MRTALVFVGGPHRHTSPPHPGLAEVRPDVVVAVDSGLHVARSLGWQADLVVGDMDSVDPAALQHALDAGVEAQRHDSDKDATDLELALRQVVAQGVRRAVVVAGDGGRMDHLLGSVLTLCDPAFAGLDIEAWLGHALVLPVRGTRTVHLRPGTLLSILPVHGDAVVRTEGLRWPLHGERLAAGTSRGLSNEVTASPAVVTVDEGVAAVVVPEEPT